MQHIKATQILKNKKGKPKDALQYENFICSIEYLVFFS